MWDEDNFINIFIKGELHSKFTPHFYHLKWSSQATAFKQNKKRIKKYWFLTKLWIFENYLFLRGSKTAPSNILGCDVIWALLSKNNPFSGAYIHIEIDLNQKVLIAMKYLFDLFLCKKDGWIQKTCLKISTTSGMMSLIRNLGQFGDVFKFASDFLGTNMVKYRVEVFSCKTSRRFRKMYSRHMKITTNGCKWLFWLIFAKLANFRKIRKIWHFKMVLVPMWPQYTTFIERNKLYRKNLKIWLIMADFLQKWLILKTGEGIELGKCVSHQ